MDKNYLPKEISWLSFNERVLQEADNKEVPLLERFKFMGIYSNNLDEYFRVRVSSLKRVSVLESKSKNILGYSPKATLKKVHDTVLIQNNKFEKIYDNLLQELRNNKIFIINEKQLDDDQADFVRKYFNKEVRSKLMPLLIEKDTKLPNLTDDAIYLAIYITESPTLKNRYALLEVPTSILPRFIVLPCKGDTKCIIFLDDIIRFGLKDIFFIFDLTEISAYTIKLTKDAELEMAGDISESYIDKLTKSLRQRKKSNPSRFIYDRTMPEDLLKVITKKLKLDPDDVVIPGNRYHNFKDFMNFPHLGDDKFYYPTLIPVPHSDLHEGESILSAIRKKDVMLYFPFNSFDYIIDLLQEASLDPDVTSIQITLYRLAINSSVINALVNAARNGKKITTVVELQARFDEEANIFWGNKLSEEGVKVIHGVPGLKVHAKLCLITRVIDNITLRYAAIGTGNFNEDTARVYTDYLLLTANKKITNEVFKVFSFLSMNYKKDKFYHLVVSPFLLRKKIISLIENEIKNAKSGKKAYICMKLNNLTDAEIIEYLYKASKWGVKIRLIIRGMFSLIPGVKNVSENIRATGIVDRFLEHSRFLIFCDGGNEKVFITSADLMTKNLDYQIEVTCPIFDKDIKNLIRNIFDIQWSDNVKARIYNENQSNSFVIDGNQPVRSQFEIYNYLNKIK